MNKLTLISLCIGASFIAAEATAQGGMGGGGGDRAARPDFASLDTNSDGFLSTEEFTATVGENTSANPQGLFARLDTDSDSMISEEEYTTRPAGGRGGQ